MFLWIFSKPVSIFRMTRQTKLRQICLDQVQLLMKNLRQNPNQPPQPTPAPPRLRAGSQAHRRALALFFQPSTFYTLYIQVYKYYTFCYCKYMVILIFIIVCIGFPDGEILYVVNRQEIIG